MHALCPEFHAAHESQLHEAAIKRMGMIEFWNICVSYFLAYESQITLCFMCES